MQPSVVIVMLGVTLATVLFFLFGRETNEQHTEHQTAYPSYQNQVHRSYNNGECTICFADLSSERTTLLHCGHQYHMKCIEDLKRHCRVNRQTAVCPLCRAVF